MSKKQILVTFSLVVIFLILGRVAYNYYHSNIASNGQPVVDESNEMGSDENQNNSGSSTGKFQAPMPDFESRITKKDFGTYVEPGNSSVFPEKFTGYHSAIDIEIIPGEENSEVPFTAICDGELAIKRMAQGYGGIVAQYCNYQGQPVTVIYGHVVLNSIPFSIGDDIVKGERIGTLGQPGPDTDDERKHLHLGIRKGHGTVILGYVPTESALLDYLNPNDVLTTN